MTGVTKLSDKPMIERIVFVNGEIINNARLEVDAPALPGFMAIVSSASSEATQYVALSTIKSITMKNKEIACFSPEYYITPEATIKVRN